LGRVDTIEVPHKRDDIAAGVTTAAVKYLLFGIDGKPIITTAFWAWPGVFDLATQLDAAAGELVLDRHMLGMVDPRVWKRVHHGVAPKC
jgi:hypothetical protein